MDWLRSPTGGIYDLAHDVAVAICRVGADHFHTGILYRHPDEKRVWLLDLAWHCFLRNDPPAVGEEYWWVEAPLSAIDDLMVTEYCLLVASRNAKDSIPYAFDDTDARLAKMTGVAMIGPTSHGFTCSTFVLAFFDAVGFPLLARESWRSRPSDQTWAESMVKRLESARGKCRKLDEHLAAIARETNCVRYRPSEVAAAWGARQLPASFNEATCLAAGIEARMDNAAES